MAEENTQQSQKTVVSFIVGLLIGGLLVWVFAGSPAKAPAKSDTKNDAQKTENTDNKAPEAANPTDGAANPEEKKEEAKPTATIGNGSIAVDAQKAGNEVALGAITYPGTDGWIAVHAMNGDALGGVIGAARYSTKDGLLPTKVELLEKAPTVAGKTYAVVFHSTDGDRTYSSKTDAVVNGADGKFLGTTFQAN
jgi:hypothetical protein